MIRRESICFWAGLVINSKQLVLLNKNTAIAFQDQIKVKNLSRVGIYMRNKNKGISTLRKILMWITVIVAAASLAILTTYTAFTVYQIEKRFAARRWNIPSKVYADSTLLYPGQAINPSLFNHKLKRLGYRNTDDSPSRKGEMRISPFAAEVYLHDHKGPFLDRTGFPVRIKLQADRIQSIIHQGTEKSLPLLELEPEEMMLFFSPDRERRLLVCISEVPKHLIHAVLAAEDSRFYDHPGVDFRGILRAFITNLREGAIRQGGSTLTQQLAKNYFLSPERTLKRKLKELLIALILEFKYEKDEILEIYLNEIYWGQKGSVSINGVGEAARFYFDKPVRDLTLVECAVLAGLIKGPNQYSPYVKNARCLKRRNEVLKQMHTNGWLDETQLQAALPLPVSSAGFTRYSRQAPYFIDYVTHQLSTLYPAETLSSLGLSIYTTLDTQVQEAAERALESGLTRLEALYPALKRQEPDQQLQGAIIVMQPKTGYILAMVGGRDYGTSQFNRATQAKRQPGSSFKPIIYLTALDSFSVTTRLANTPREFIINGKSWHPKNFEDNAKADVTFREGLAESHNLATINLAMEIGLDHIVDTAARFQFSTPVKPYPSAALGAFEVIPLELARAYCVFASGGIQPFPLSLKEVKSETGQILEQRHASIKRLIPPDKAYIINDLLKSVVTRGTARSLKNGGVNWPVAGKTGTTNDSRDAWFVGYTPDILALVWVGFDNGDSVSVTGAKAALPIWTELMKAVPQYVSGEWFTMPEGVVRRVVCSESGKLAVKGSCPDPVEEVFLEDQAPVEVCPVHTENSIFKKFWKGIRDVVPSS